MILVFGGKNEGHTVDEKEIFALKFGKYTGEDPNDGLSKVVVTESIVTRQRKAKIEGQAAALETPEKIEVKQCLKETIIEELGKFLPQSLLVLTNLWFRKQTTK